MFKRFIEFLPHRRLLFSILFVLIPTVVFSGDYLVGSGDVLKIDVYDHKDLQTTVRVTNDGNIVVPLLGQVSVGGMKISDVAEKLTLLLADGYIISPQVNIFIEDFRSKKAVILGHVTSPGLIELRESTTFLEVVSRAGGFRAEAGDTATIKRIIDDKQQVIVVNIKSMVEGGDISQNVTIHDGDTIYIAKGGTCFVTGEVKQPNAYPYEQGTTVLKLITRAGGFTGKASKSSVNIVRLVNGEKSVLEDVDLHTEVLANDIIIVPESFF